METKTIIDTCIFLSKTHRDLQRERNKYIYQIIISILSLEAVFIGSLLSKTYQINYNIKPIIYLALVSFAILTAYHLFHLHRANHRNQEYAEKSEKECQKLISKSFEIKNPKSNGNSYTGCHMWLWQSCFVIVGTTFSIFIVFIS
ncbi:MAG: hypothetical protein WCR46_17485 [Deltaproteobacteria bacterium]